MRQKWTEQKRKHKNTTQQKHNNKKRTEQKNKTAEWRERFQLLTIEDNILVFILHLPTTSKDNKATANIVQVIATRILEGVTILVCVAGVPGEAIPVSSEEEIFHIIGMDFKSPEERNVWCKSSLEHPESIKLPGGCL